MDRKGSGLKKQYSIFTLGCKVNQVDSAAMDQALQKAGYRKRPFGEPANLVIINTCAVTANADRDGRKLTTRARTTSPEGFIVVTGCSPGHSQPPDAYTHADLVCGNVEKADILSLIEKRITRSRPIEQISSPDQFDDLLSLDPVSMPGRTRAYLKVQDGCDHSCAYCIVPLVRGKSRSVKMEKALEGFKALADQGFKEIVLVGIHLGDWGRDLTPKSRLTDLADALTSACPDVRLRLTSVEPPEVDDDLIDLMAKKANLCRHIHLPVQSGSDAILKAMNREYGAKELMILLEKIISAIPDVTIGTDIIVGFPGETDDDFQKTYELVEKYPLTHLHVFPFSKRPGTLGEKMKNTLDPAVVKKRSAVLRKLGMEKRKEHYKTFIGKTMEVLCEGEKEKGKFGGMSGNYIPVRFDESVKPGRMATVKITDTDFSNKIPALFGKVEKE